MSTDQISSEHLKPALAPGNSYAAHQLLDILGEARRNIVAGTTMMNHGSFNHAALYFEMVAEKLRVVQREYDESANAARSQNLAV